MTRRGVDGGMGAQGIRKAEVLGEPRELWSASDIARALDVDPSTVARWQARSDFPAPAFETVSQMRAWNANEIREWRREVVRARRERMVF